MHPSGRERERERDYHAQWGEKHKKSSDCLIPRTSQHVHFHTYSHDDKGQHSNNERKPSLGDRIPGVLARNAGRDDLDDAAGGDLARRRGGAGHDDVDDGAGRYRRRLQLLGRAGEVVGGGRGAVDGDDGVALVAGGRPGGGGLADVAVGGVDLLGRCGPAFVRGGAGDGGGDGDGDGAVDDV